MKKILHILVFTLILGSLLALYPASGQLARQFLTAQTGGFLELGELGDAPDSRNHSGVTMMAYPGVTANFPTVGDPILPVGPNGHGFCHGIGSRLGSLVSNDGYDADGSNVPPDTDGIKNIDPVTNNFDQDESGRSSGGDDSLTLTDSWTMCQPATITITGVAFPPAQVVNVWFDWNRDGDWSDDAVPGSAGCSSDEWAVRNLTVGPGPFTISPTVLPVGGVGEIWARVTLSDQPVDIFDPVYGPLGGQSVGCFADGETEDFLMTPQAGTGGDTGGGTTGGGGAGGGAQTCPPVQQASGTVAKSGSEFMVNTEAAQMQLNTSITMNASHQSVMVWESSGLDSLYDIMAQRYDSSGNPLGAELVVNSITSNAQSNPDIGIANNGNFVVTWESIEFNGDRPDINARRFDSAGNPFGDEFLVNTNVASFNKERPEITVASDGRFVITWQSNGQDGDVTGVYARRFDSSGNPVGNEFQVNTVTTNAQQYPDVAIGDNGDFIIVWESYDQETGSIPKTDASAGIFARRYSPAGAAIDPTEFQVNTTIFGAQQRPVVAGDTDLFVVAWESLSQDGDNFGIFARRFDSQGGPLSAEFQVNSYSTNAQANATIDINSSGDFVIAWDSFDQIGQSFEIYAKAYASDGSPIGSIQQVNTFTTDVQRFPSISFGQTQFVVAWESKDSVPAYYDVFAQRFDFTLTTPPQGPTECSDGVDNADPEDTLIDAADPACLVS
ncbi:MAG: GEVED domain-containing protein, partial [Candidatus Gracilibacteria bacterium]|nr:GEVED domain-containing protein [Candidatus Gracilibacteria bacterium]